ncbi:hypothetical protein OPV22_015253 [Ensete ventricosum]|uniref:UV radiation resistance protein/autophagy-related protein 14 n=1 Tax=Ensete ventricosum TaxID=4639 RepID=A0AAV8R9W7_ENSVE|nr:hypothetical protein OPV22_015253 [Ensete ventricosum]
MARKPSSSSCCTICEGSNLSSICASCVNHRLNEYSVLLRSLTNIRESLYSRLNDELAEKRKATHQSNWRVTQNEKIRKLKEHLTCSKRQLVEVNAKVVEASNNLKLRYDSLDSAFATIKNHMDSLDKLNSDLIYSQCLAYMAITSERLHKQSMVIRQICRLFPMRRVNLDGANDGSNGPYDQICNARLPRGLDPHSVPSEELAASLGYMVQLLNLVVPNLAAPLLHNSGFAGSCSLIWQRDSYWDARPSSQSKEYPLFISRQNFCSSIVESSSNYDLSSMESEGKLYLDTTSRSGSFSYSCASPHSLETHVDLQKGISLVKKSVACITTCCYNSLCLDVPSQASTFEAFAKLLAALSSSRELQSTRNSLKMACSRPAKQAQQLNRSVWDETSGNLSSSLTTVSPNARDYHHFLNSDASFVYSAEVTASVKSESLVEGWDIVERPPLPSPQSQVEDVEHWTLAIYTDATKR